MGDASRGQAGCEFFNSDDEEYCVLLPFIKDGTLSRLYRIRVNSQMRDGQRRVRSWT